MQGRSTGPHPTTAPRACVVCAEPLDWNMALTPRQGARASSSELYPLCRKFDCRMVFEQGVELSDIHFRHHLRWRVQIWREQRAKARSLQERREAESREADAVFSALAPRAGRGSPPDLWLVVPSGHAPLRPLSRRRRRAYAAHLDAIIAAALDEPAPPVQPASSPEAGAADPGLPARLCGLCGGGCCASGGNLAYLSAATIQRVMAASPGLDPDQLRATYLGYLAPRTVSGSCLHHTRDGCSLPRSLRSDVCNNYACAALKRLQGGLLADPSVRKVVALRRRQNNWNQANPALNNDIVSGAVLTRTATIRLRPPPRKTTDGDGDPLLPDGP